MGQRQCGDCKYHIKEDGEWYCDNLDSDNYACQTDYNDVCVDFESRR